MGKTTAKVLRAIVRNDAMKEDPDEIYNWRVFALVFSSCFGGMLFGWETGAIGGVLAMDATQERYGYAHWDKKDKSLMDQNIVSTLQIGCWVSCYFTGWLADKYGRRLCLIGTGLFTIIGVVFQAASAAQGTIAVMYVGRFLAGLGVGAASTLVPLYVSECVPRAVRGGLTAFYQLFIVTGVMISFWVNYGSLLHIKGQAVFIVPLTLQVTPAVLLAICMTFQKERYVKYAYRAPTCLLTVEQSSLVRTKG
jgi:MFS family permease